MMTYFYSRWVPFKLSKQQLDKQVIYSQLHQDTAPKIIRISSYIFWLNLSNLLCQFYLNRILQYVTLVLPVCHFWCLWFLNRFTTSHRNPPTDEPKCPRRTEMDEAIFAAHDALSHREARGPNDFTFIEIAPVF